jgi:hypothetical protein
MWGAAELALILFEWCVIDLGFVLDSPLIGSPLAQPSPEGEESIFGLFRI